jgi:hypothetical protein
VFLVLSSNNPISIKAAHHVKVPYVKDKLDFTSTKMVNHGWIYNLIYGIEKEHFITYFQMKNNVIYYHRKLSNASQFFWFKTNLSNYELIDFSNLRYSIKTSENLLIKTGKGKWYIISNDVECDNRKNCLALIDATVGRHLFLDSKDNNLLLKFFYPLAEAVFPILQVTRREIFVHLFDLSNNEIRVASWDISGSIRNLILLLSNKAFFRSVAKDIENDTIDLSLRECKLKTDYYDLVNGKITNGIGRILVELDLILLGSEYKYVIENLHIVMSIEDSGYGYFSLKLNLDVEAAAIYFFESKRSKRRFAYFKFSEYFKDSSTINFLSQEYSINKTLSRDRIYINNVIYKDECRYIVWNNAGIRIFDKSDFIGERIIKAGDSRINVHGCASMYTHGKYVIIVTDVGYGDVKLIVLYPENKSIGIWKIEDENWDCTDNKGIYNYHYDASHNRLIFLSQDLQCLFFVEIEKMEKVLKSTDETGCKSKSYRNIRELGKAFNLKKLIAKTINEYHKPHRDSGKTENQSNKQRIRFLGYYIDKYMNKLYIAAKYSLYGLEYVGLFMSHIGKQMGFHLLSSVLNESTYDLYYNKWKLQTAKVRGIASFLNWTLYDFPKRTVGSLGLYYNKNNRFIDINYNRQSNKLLGQDNNYDLRSVLSYNIWNLIIIMSECKNLDKETLLNLSDLELRFYCNKAYGFVLGNLNLVRGMPITIV